MGEAAVGRKMMRATGAIALALLLALGVCASSATAEPLSMTFTEARANVGVQLSDTALFEAPDVAPLEAQIGPAGESITAGVLQVPQFSTHITTPIDANVTVDFDIGVITGSFTQATGALTLSGTAGGTLTAEGEECTVSTTPSPLILSTTGNNGGTSPRSGAPFTHGLTGAGAIAGQWTDMQATPVRPGDTENVNFCNNVETRIRGAGGIWLVQKGDVVPPSAPQLTSTDPASPNSEWHSADPRRGRGGIDGAPLRGPELRGLASRTPAAPPSLARPESALRSGRASLRPSRRPPPTQPATPRPARRRSHIHVCAKRCRRRPLASSRNWPARRWRGRRRC